jgi:nicotinamidase-related amidase
MGNGTSAWDQLSTNSAQLLLCDLQPQIVARSKTIEPEALGKSAGVLLEIARLFSLPTILSVVAAGGEAPEPISELRGSGFAQEKLRVSVSPFKDEATKSLLAQSKRKVLIIGGFAIEAVVLHAVLDARAEGYEVLVAVDACGGMSERTERAVLRQIEASGADVTAVVSIATKLAPGGNFMTDLGRELFNVVQKLRLA